jgi:hypothetical protein
VVEVVTFDTPSLGDRSYLVHDGALATVVDPQRDHHRFLRAAQLLDDLGGAPGHAIAVDAYGDRLDPLLDPVDRPDRAADVIDQHQAPARA